VPWAADVVAHAHVLLPLPREELQARRLHLHVVCELLHLGPKVIVRDEGHGGNEETGVGGDKGGYTCQSLSQGAAMTARDG
jgi:hypothetical protein